MASDAKGPRLKRSIWMEFIERPYVAQQISFHMNEVIRTIVGMPVNDDFFARKVLLYLFAIDLLDRRVHSGDSGEFVASAIHGAIQLKEVHRKFQS